MSGSCTCPTSCRPRGRRWSTPTIPTEGTVAVLGLGPIGQMSCRIAQHHGASEVFGIDLVPDRLEMARRHGVDAVDRRA